MKDLVDALENSKFAKDWNVDVYELENPDIKNLYNVCFEAGREIVGTELQEKAEKELIEAVAEADYDVEFLRWVPSNPDEIMFIVQERHIRNLEGYKNRCWVKKPRKEA